LIVRLSTSMQLFSKQSDGDGGISQPMIMESFVVTDIQNECTDWQVHRSWK